MMYSEILSTALNSKERLLKLISYPSDIFDHFAYRTIMEELKELSSTVNDIDLGVLTSSLKSSGNFAKVKDVLPEIMTANISVNFDYHLNQLVQEARTRELKMAKVEFIKDQVTEEEANSKYDEVCKKYMLDTDICCEMSEFIDADFETIFPKDNFIEWRLKAFNDALVGMFKGNFILIAGEPGVGKTTFVNGEARIGRTLYFNLEVTRRETFAKYLQEETGIHVKKIMANKYLTEKDMEKIGAAKEDLKKELNFKMYDKDNSDFNFIKSKIKFEIMTGSYDKILIDNLQLVRNIGDGEAGMANLTGTLKQMAKDLAIPIIGISHLTKAAYTSGGRPTLGSPKGGGSLVQDPDTIIFIYKDENKRAIFDCQKDRFGIPGRIQGIDFDPVFMKYIDVEYRFSDCHEPRGLGWDQE